MFMISESRRPFIPHIVNPQNSGMQAGEGKKFGPNFDEI